MSKLKNSFYAMILTIILLLLGTTVFAVTKLKNEQVKQINDSEIMELLSNAHYTLMEIFNSVYNEDSVFQDKEGQYYTKLPEKINSSDKLFGHLNKYFTLQTSSRFIDFFNAKEREGKYSIICGELGLGTFDIKNAKLIRKELSENKIKVFVEGKNGADETKEYRADIVYEDKQWKVSYWQWGFEIFGK